VCLRSRPRCDMCPVQDDCVALATHRIDQLPAPRPAKSLPHRDVRVLVIERDGALLFEKRPSNGVWGGLWSLPECALDDDARSIVRIRYGADVDVRDALPLIKHGFTHFALTMHPQRLRASQWPQSAQEQGTTWLTPHDALQAALPSPIRKLMLGLT